MDTMEQSKPAYYAVIPANVRYDDKLIPSAKLLYGEITALCNKKGYCWSTNKYFAELYNVSEKSITIWINSLIEGGYIDRKIIYKNNSKEILARHLILKNIEPMEEKQNTYGIKGNDRTEENFHRGMEEKVRDNITVVNNTKNKKIYGEVDDFFESIWSLYPKKEGKGSISKSQKLKLFKIGVEEITRAINRYKKKIQDEGIEKKYVKQGSTFFNSGYIDYLDSNSNVNSEVKTERQPLKMIMRDYI